MGETLLKILPWIWGAYLVVLSIWIVLEKRSPQATIGWLLVLAWFPIVGWLIYYFIGPRKLKRHALVRVQNRNVLTSYRSYLKEQLANASQFYPDLKLDEHGLHDMDDATYEKIAGKIKGFTLPSLISFEARQISRVIYKSTGLPIAVGSAYELLEGGAKTYDAIFEAIRQAKHTIHLEYYIYAPDTTGTMLRDLLTEKAREGVKVRLLLDWLGSRKITHAYMADFLAAGGELAFFHKSRIMQFQSLINMRLHRKIVVCDGRVGFTGGVNIWDMEDERRRPDANSDLHLKIEGPVVYWLEEVFLEDWYYTTKKIPQDIPPPVPLESIPLDQVQQMQVIAAGPDTPDAPILRAKLMAINAAKQRVWLTTPYFLPDDLCVYALTTAAMRGVDVRVMVPQNSNHRVAELAAQSWYQELMDAGVQIWAYQPKRLIHTKSLLVDECYSFVGTDNFDIRSFRLNFEVVILNYERSAASALAAQFERDMQSSKLLQDDDLNSRWWRRLPEDVARLASPLL